MVISRLNLNKIQKDISLIQGYLSELREFEGMTESEFLSEKKNAAACESYLRRTLECVFDISRHILAKTYGYKELEYKGIARTLGEKGVVSEDFSNILVKMAGYRNRMVHLYREISDAELYQILQNNLTDIDRFIKEIALFLEKYNNSL
ncbi:MAG: DUF86 domain-containing protein [Nitrospirae bacterium]|nr:MAG: DUF86 domain-containing protein [Nitrospirota bacterium]